MDVQGYSVRGDKATQVVKNSRHIVGLKVGILHNTRGKIGIHIEQADIHLDNSGLEKPSLDSNASVLGIQNKWAPTSHIPHLQVPEYLLGEDV